MSFGSLKGQDRAIVFLKGVAESGRVANSYIFVGPSGCGRKTAALGFAKLLNCSGPLNGEPCGECHFCKKISNSSCPDVKILTKAKDKTEIGIDIILEAVRSIALKPYEARRKVYIIDGADEITDDAANAILKTLEEPPPSAVLVLIAENYESLLPTIRSRSQAVKFFPVPTADIERILEDAHKIDREKAKLFSRISSGSVGRAIRFSKGNYLEERLRVIESVERGTFFGSDLDGLKRDVLRSHLEIMLSWYRDILVTKASRSAPDSTSPKISPDIINVDKASDIKVSAGALGFDYLQRAIDRILETMDALDKNANPKLAMAALGTMNIE